VVRDIQTLKSDLRDEENDCRTAEKRYECWKRPYLRRKEGRKKCGKEKKQAKSHIKHGFFSREKREIDQRRKSSCHLKEALLNLLIMGFSGGGGGREGQARSDPSVKD